MLVQVAHLDPTLLALVVFGLLTIFGRKKKDEREEEAKAKDSASNIPSPKAWLGTTPQATKTSEIGNMRDSLGVGSLSEETDSLTKLLQSLMQDLPPNPPSNADQASTRPQSTPEYVPPRNNPPSRPMVILPGDKGKKFEPLSPVQPSELVEPAYKKAVRPQEPPEAPPRGSVEPAPARALQNPEADEEEVKKSLKPEKLEKAVKLEPPKPPTNKAAQGFEHVFDLTQGSLKTPGLVVITGPPGSGKTTLCQSLAGSYLKQGGPCLFVAYDKPASAVRDGMKKLGYDPANYESQFRLLVVDGYSAQSGAFSMELYSVEKPFDLENVEDILVRNSQIFMGEKTAVIFDSLNALVSRIPAKEFVSKFREMVSKLKETGAIFVVAVDPGKLSKDFAGPLQEMADCTIALEKEGVSGGNLRIVKANGSDMKSEPEAFEIDTSKGLLFV
jgi:KaiC/GvpD/RAD55 family RecA-like ATPase